MLTAQNIRLLQAITPILGESWANRWQVAHYVSLCEMQGFAQTDEQKRQCALRYIAGKRKVSPPGTKRRKREAKARANAVASASQELKATIADACTTDAAMQYKAGNAKALNALVGHVMKKHKADPAVIRALILSALT